MREDRKLPAFLDADDRQLLLFGGKGGVGKTTAAAATAMDSAIGHPDKSILLVSTDPAHSLRDSLSGGPVPANLQVLELDSQTCLLDFKAENRERLQEIVARGTFLDTTDISTFLDLSLPGMDEIMGFIEINRWVAEKTYAEVVVDTAPTGHALRLIGMPDLMQRWLEALDALLAKHRYMKKLYQGSYRQDDLDQFIGGLATAVKQMRELLQDHQRCRFIPVTLAEAMSVNETLDLIRELKRLGIGTEDVVVNRLYPANSCSLCMDIRARQLAEIARLGGEELFSDVRLWGVPMYPLEVAGPDSLGTFWAGLERLAPSTTVVPPASPPVAPRVDHPLPRPEPAATLLVFAGKGGVGKTTMACATALHLAHRSRRVLLFSADPAHSLADCLDLRIGPKPTPVVPGLWAMEVDACAEFAALREQYQHEVAELLTKLLPNLDLTFDREVMERVMDLSPPGIDELMALTTAMDFLFQDRYDLVVLDAAPTGHLLRLLELPEVVEGWLKAVFGIFLKYRSIFRLPRITERLVKISKDLKSLRALLRDPARAGLYAVSILTEMSFAETTDLAASCTRLQVPLRGLFLNLVTPPAADPLCRSIRERELPLAERFAAAFPAMPQAVVFRQSDPRGVERLSVLGQLLYGADGDGARPDSRPSKPEA